jgi:acyl-coenzyme A synthetase/AMP-(fatty) acid ligase
MGAFDLCADSLVTSVYTSGTTGLPKGVVRSAGGHAVGLNLNMKQLFGVHGPGDVQFTASDIGWVVGHSYIVYVLDCTDHVKPYHADQISQVRASPFRCDHRSI